MSVGLLDDLVALDVADPAWLRVGRLRLRGHSGFMSFDESSERGTSRPRHKAGGLHKARVFELALGITVANAEILRAALGQAAANSDAALAKGDQGFGEMFVLRFPLTTNRGTATILSAWIIRHGEDFPRPGNVVYSLMR